MTPREGRIFTAGFEGAAEQLAVRGLVDRQRVGISGFSRTGWHVEYALTHSEFPFAAAIAADNIDSNYMQALVLPWVWPSFVASNGGEPFAAGIKAWLEESPAFGVERIRAPLRLQVNSGALPVAMTHWEMFARLKYLNKPVELYVIPNIEQGTHNLQNPRQLLASAGGAVDWFDFWLNDHEDPAPAKAEQYERWRKLKVQRDVDMDAPRSRQLEWKAIPKPVAARHLDWGFPTHAPSDLIFQASRSCPLMCPYPAPHLHPSAEASTAL
jgi:hypothetical protein